MRPSNQPVTDQRRNLRRLLVSRVFALASLIISLTLRLADHNWLPWSVLIGALMLACAISIGVGIHRLTKIRGTGSLRDVHDDAD